MLYNKFLTMSFLFVGTSWPVAAFLLVNAALGAGVLNYPYAYDKAGGVYFAAFLQIVSSFFLF